MSTITNSLNNDSNFLTAATGMTATTGDITASTGDIVASVGNLVATDGNLVLTSGRIALGGSFGSSGDVLTSQGNVTAPIWAPASGGGMTWHGSVGEALVANNGYIVVGNIDGGFTLPAAPALGDTFTVASWSGYGASNSWVIYADENHTIEIGSQAAATSIASTVAGDVITLTCVYSAAPQYSFLATSVIGNITVTP
jgi:hypothetical protein